MTYQKQVGDKGEQIAADFLCRKGYQLLERNFISRYGEIDLVALENDCVVFVEVKTRTTQSFGLPEASITPAKLERIQNAGLMWLQAHPESPEDWRIDVVAIILDGKQQIQDIEHFVNVRI